MPIVEWLWERVTGRPYWTGASMAAQFGPTLATEFPEEVAILSDAELMAAYPGSVGEWHAALRAARAVSTTGDESVLTLR